MQARKLRRFLKLLGKEDDLLYRSRLFIFLNSVPPPSRAKRGSFDVSLNYERKQRFGVLFSTLNPCLNSVSVSVQFQFRERRRFVVPFSTRLNEVFPSARSAEFLAFHHNIEKGRRFLVPFSNLIKPYSSEFNFPLSREARKL